MMKARKTRLKEFNRKLNSSRTFYDKLNTKTYMLDSSDFLMHRNDAHVATKGDSGATTPKARSLPISVRLQAALDRLHEMDLND